MITQNSNDILKFDDLAISVFEWAKEKNLIVKGNEFNQIHKVKEEIDEIVEAIQIGRASCRERVYACV